MAIPLGIRRLPRPMSHVSSRCAVERITSLLGDSPLAITTGRIRLVYLPEAEPNVCELMHPPLFWDWHVALK